MGVGVWGGVIIGVKGLGVDEWRPSVSLVPSPFPVVLPSVPFPVPAPVSFPASGEPACPSLVFGAGAARRAAFARLTSSVARSTWSWRSEALAFSEASHSAVLSAASLLNSSSSLRAMSTTFWSLALSFSRSLRRFSCSVPRLALFSANRFFAAASRVSRWARVHSYVMPVKSTASDFASASCRFCLVSASMRFSKGFAMS